MSEILTKKCADCRESKKLTEFGKDKKRKDGLNPYCKNCHNVKNKVWKKANREKVKATNRTYKENNPDKVKAINKSYRESNPEKSKTSNTVWYKINRKRQKDTTKKWKKDNPDKTNAQTARRRAKKLRATPLWLTLEQKQQIDNIYTECSKLTRETGIPHEVDHIIPLQGKEVRGLHVPWNLQILTASENRSKNNNILFDKK